MERDYEYIFEQREQVTFDIVDYVVFGLTLLVSASIGLYYAIKDRKKTDEKEFLLAGRSMQTFPVALSLLSSFISAITLLGTPAEVYTNNTMYWWISIGFIISAAGTAHIFVPVFYQLEITSVFQYIELRFGHICRVVGSIIYLLWMLLYMSVVLYGPSLALNAVTGLSLWGSIIAVGLVCIFYTTLGGMKAVVWTDSFQMLVMFAGMLALLISGSMKLGGLDVAWDIAERNQRILFFEFDPDPSVRHTTWNVIVGGGFFWMAIYGINQAQVQRAISVPSVKHARTAIWLNFPGMFIILSLVCSVGVVMYAFYSTCDPVSIGVIKKTDQLIPLFTMDLLGHLHGLPGLVLSCVFSGSLSTISSGLNAVAAVLLEDFVKPYFCKKISGRAATLFSKATVVGCGLVCLALAYFVSELGAILQLAYVLFGILGGPLLGLFTFGMLCPWGNAWGGTVGILTSLAFVAWIGLGTSLNNVVVTPKSPLTTAGCNMTAINALRGVATTLAPTTSAVLASTNPAVVKPPEDYFLLYRMSYIWYTGLAVITVLFVGSIVSLITGGHKRMSQIDPRVICPFFDVFMPFLPESFRRKMRCGVRHGDEEFIAQFCKTQDEKLQHEGNHNMSIEISQIDLSEKKEVTNGYAPHNDTDLSTKL
ncbi:sodium-dependent multivitamin transporter-like [Saccostrea cucullata]|uniref:sodium-dependent multivitamin transporter-like n=1 Tax=Saccostrea cuccullata TaxID=36930 RepID=UPI002ED5B01B